MITLNLKTVNVHTKWSNIVSYKLTTAEVPQEINIGTLQESDYKDARKNTHRLHSVRIYEKILHELLQCPSHMEEK